MDLNGGALKKLNWVKFSYLREQLQICFFIILKSPNVCVSCCHFHSCSLSLSSPLYFLFTSCPWSPLRSEMISPSCRILGAFLITFHILSAALILTEVGMVSGDSLGKIKPIRLLPKARMRHKNLWTNLWPLLHHFIRQGSSDDILPCNHLLFSILRFHSRG